MTRIAICGGIGSGKSAVTAILRELGAKVVVADEVNAALMNEPAYVTAIRNIFPTVVHNNIINKKELAQIIYRDEGKRQALMDLAHPLIFERMFAAYPNDDLVFYEIPLFSKCAVSFDAIIYLDADEDVRIHRIVERDGATEERAKRILSLQKEEGDCKQRATFVLSNNGAFADLSKSVKQLYCYILEHFS